MTARDILRELETMGSASYKKVLMNNHGVREPCFGVKISDLTRITKREKKNHELALELYATGNYDAMYLAGFIADDAKMTRKDLQRWVEQAEGGALANATVPSVAAGSPHGAELASEWINSPTPSIAVAGWMTAAMLASTAEQDDLPLLRELLARAYKTIHAAPDPVRYAMNRFIISVGSYVRPLAEDALKLAEQIGELDIDMGNNACKVPYAPDYIRKARARGSLEKKRKSARC